MDSFDFRRLLNSRGDVAHVWGKLMKVKAGEWIQVYDPERDRWFKYKVITPLAVQFTAHPYRKKREVSFFFYKDFGTTWKYSTKHTSDYGSNDWCHSGLKRQQHQTQEYQ